jgi:hypothetical protein
MPVSLAAYWTRFTEFGMRVKKLQEVENGFEGEGLEEYLYSSIPSWGGKPDKEFNLHSLVTQFKSR